MTRNQKRCSKGAVNESPSLRRNEREMRSKYNNNNQLINLKN